MSAIHAKSSRYANRISAPLLVWMICFAILTAAGGITYAGFKNKQQAIRNEISLVERSIAKTELNINEHKAKINTLTGRWNLISRLDSLGSDICDISPENIDRVRFSSDSQIRTATAAR